MQILVLGMHRSGTSMVARLLNMMGAIFAPEGVSTGANQENPKGLLGTQRCARFERYGASLGWGRLASVERFFSAESAGTESGSIQERGRQKSSSTWMPTGRGF